MKLKEIIKELNHKLSALSLACKHCNTPLLAKIVAIIAVAYALSPIDLVPDFIPVLGYIDDIIILPLLIALAVKLIPKNIMNECLIQAEYMWQNGKPKNWKYALPIILIWILIIIIVVCKILM